MKKSTRGKAEPPLAEISASWLDRTRTYNYLINSQAFYLLNYKPVMRVKSKEWQHPPEI
jgi:hypothetical protein